VRGAPVRTRPAVKVAATDDAVVVAEPSSCGNEAESPGMVVTLPNEDGADAWVLFAGVDPRVMTVLAGRPAGATAGATRFSVCESRPTVREVSRAVEATVSVVGCAGFVTGRVTGATECVAGCVAGATA
jgi:hypothetical protein